jgi:hypothetical protein
MTLPTQTHPDYQHPRWLLRAAAWGSALIYGCIFVAANIGPQPRGQVHGWPFVYMVREGLVPGGLTIVYGPWPLFSPPLISFELRWLLLNVLCGIILTFLAAVISLYWLRRCRRLQFGLRSLFAAVALVACLLSAFKVCFPKFGSGLALFEIGWCMFVLARMLVYTIPVGCVVTAAHRAVILSAASQRRRRWAGLHWLTWLAIAFVGGLLMHYSIFVDTSCISEFGWPFTYQADHEACCWFSSEFMQFLLPMSCLKALGLIADILVWLAMTAATAFVVERWIRRIEQAAPTRPALFLAGAVLAGGMIFAMPLDQSSQHIWYEYPIWLLGIACAIFVALLAVFSGAAWLCLRFRAPTP